jgi:hypothetical protein
MLQPRPLLIGRRTTFRPTFLILAVLLLSFVWFVPRSIIHGYGSSSTPLLEELVLRGKGSGGSEFGPS